MSALDTKSVIDDIFRLTAQKLDENDPVVVAALFQADCIKRAGDHAAANLNEAVERLSAAADLNEVVERLSAAADKVKADGTLAHARNQDLIARLPGLIKAAVVQPRRDLFDSPGISNAVAPDAHRLAKDRWRGAAIAAAWFVVGAATAGIAGFATGHLSASLNQDAAVGRAFTRALPFLRPDDKERLLEEIERQR